jgi:hypothetical protein
MLTHRIFTTVASILTLATAPVFAQDVLMGLGINKRHYQTTPFFLQFDGGELFLTLGDGVIILDACATDPQLFFFGPNLVCPLGATALIAQGDVDRDGIRDDNQYWSVLSIVPAGLIEPGRPELCQLYSAPPSKLPRPLQNFRDDSLVTFYDVSTAIVRPYDVTGYELVRPYGSVRQVETALALGEILLDGSLQVIVTGADIVGSPLTVNVPVSAGLAAGDWAENVRIALAAVPAITDVYTVGGQGGSIVLTEILPDGNDPTLNVAINDGTAGGNALPLPNSNNSVTGVVVASAPAALKQMREELVHGQYVFTFPRLNNPSGIPVAIPVTVLPNLEAVDPTSRVRSGFRFTSGLWDQGVYQMDPRTITTITWQGNDRTVVRPGDRIFFSILNRAEDFITFPPTVPQNPILLSSPTVQNYTLPPFFYEVGEEGVMRLEYRRFLPSNGIAFDISQRDFRARIKMVDSYRGYAQITFPLGTRTRDTSPTANFDRDAMTNAEEFAFQYPTNEDINATAREQFEPQPTGVAGVVEEFSRVVNKVDEAILDGAVQPAGPSATYLDADNRAVVDIPVRPRTGSTLRYAFEQVVPGRKRGLKIKPGTTWEIVYRDEPSVFNATIEVKFVDVQTRDILAIGERAVPTPVNLTQRVMMLRTIDPVANPADPLPVIRVKPGVVTLK